ncbi:hypothetical protein BHE74_00051804 [Ensete ventricosum]|nr:hypothetical protein BHE74_00051804 [Ensete ventricosum]
MSESLIAKAVIALSMLDLPQDCRATANPALIVAQPPPFLALEAIPRLGEKKPPPIHTEIADRRRNQLREKSPSPTRSSFGKEKRLSSLAPIASTREKPGKVVWEKRLREKPSQQFS